MFFKLGVLKNIAIFVKTSVLESLSNNVAGLQASNFIKRDSDTGVFLRILQNFQEKLLI